MPQASGEDVGKEIDGLRLHFEAGCRSYENFEPSRDMRIEASDVYIVLSDFS